MFGKKTVADFVISAATKKAKETWDGYNQKKATEQDPEQKQPTSNAQPKSGGTGWGTHPTAGAGGYAQTTLVPLTAEALMTILKLHAQGVTPELIAEAVSTKEMRVTQKNVGDYTAALMKAGWNVTEK